MDELNIAESRLVPLNSPSDYARALELGSGNGGVAAIIDELPYVEIFLSKYCKFKTVGQVFTKSGWGFVSGFAFCNQNTNIYFCSEHLVIVLYSVAGLPKRLPSR